MTYLPRLEELIGSRWVSTPQVGRSHGRSYDVRNSSTATLYRNETFYLGFPQSSISGFVVHDTIAIGYSTLSLRDFAFGSVQQESPGIKNQPFDGILGLGFTGDGPNGTPFADWTLDLSS